MTDRRLGATSDGQGPSDPAQAAIRDACARSIDMWRELAERWSDDQRVQTAAEDACRVHRAIARTAGGDAPSLHGDPDRHHLQRLEDLLGQLILEQRATRAAVAAIPLPDLTGVAQRQMAVETALSRILEHIATGREGGGAAQ